MKRLIPKPIVIINIVAYAIILIYTTWNFIEAQIMTQFDLWFSIGGLIVFIMMVIPLFTMFYYVTEKKEKEKN